MKALVLAAVFTLSFGAPAGALAQTDPTCPFAENGWCVDASGNRIRPLDAAVQAPAANTPGAVNVSYIRGYAKVVSDVINYYLVPIILALAFLMFVWGVYKAFFLEGDNEEERAKGRMFIMWAVIGFVAIFSIWGLVALVGSSLGLSAGGRPTASQVPQL